MQAWTLFLVSIERGTSRRVYHRRPWLFDTSQFGVAPCWLLARLAVARVGVVGPTRAGFAEVQAGPESRRLARR